MDKKVIRMLKGALFPHITDYNLEIKYEKTDTPGEEAEDFEVIEKVMDALDLTGLEAEDGETESAKGQKPMSLFDNSVNENNHDVEETGANSKYHHLPPIAVPRYLQTPFRIPDLYPFNRTTVYLLLSDCNPDLTPKSILLKGTYQERPLELEIPIVSLAETSNTIHQLAARKEIKELEEGRGWLSKARDGNGKLFKDRFDGMYSDMVEREAVRLGVDFQVGGKWSSFVAIEESTANSDSQSQSQPRQINIAKTMGSNDPSRAPQAPRRQLASKSARKSGPSTLGFARPSLVGRGGRGGAKRHRKIAKFDLQCEIDEEDDDHETDAMGLSVVKRSRLDASVDEDLGGPLPLSEAEVAKRLQDLIALQSFAGNWTWDSDLENVLGIARTAAMQLALPDALASHASKDEIVATSCALVFLKRKFKTEKETLEVLVGKAETWLEAQGCGNAGDLENIVEALF